MYFDKYEIPIVNKVTSSNVKYNSITLSVDAASKVSTIAKYYYSKDNGQSYIETTTNQYIFNDLESNKTYNFKVYVKDANGIASKEYSLNVSTSTYVNPSITKVTTSNISATSITLNVTATAGSNSISKYYYSNNNGSTWVNSTSSSYTFNNLTAGKSYTFKVYVGDSGNHQSNEYTITEVATSGIKFKIEGVTYYGNPYASYATWESWVDSQYNNSPYGLWNNGNYIEASLAEGQVIADDSGPVNPSDEIRDGEEYYLMYYGG